MLRPPGLPNGGTPSCGRNLLSECVQHCLPFQLSARLPRRPGHVSSGFLPECQRPHSCPLFSSPLAFSLNLSYCFIFLIEFRLFKIMFYKVSLYTHCERSALSKCYPRLGRLYHKGVLFTVSFWKIIGEWKKKTRKN